MKTLNIVARTSTYSRSTTNNSTTVAIAGLDEAIRLERDYPTREFVKDVQRARNVFDALMTAASSGAYQVFKSDGFIRRIDLFSLNTQEGNEKQHHVQVRLALGRVVVTHTLPNGYSKTDVGYKALISALEKIADADIKTSRAEEDAQPHSKTIKAEDVRAATAA